MHKLSRNNFLPNQTEPYAIVMDLPLQDNDNKRTYNVLPIPSHSRNKAISFRTPPTPPLHPKVSVPFMWEEAPGRAKPTRSSTPFTPIGSPCLDPPPRMRSHTRRPDTTCYSITTINYKPTYLGRSVSQRFHWADPIGPNSNKCGRDLGLDGNGPSKEKVSRDQMKAQNGSSSCRWAGEKVTKWDPYIHKIGLSVPPNKGLDYDGVDIKVRLTRFKRSKKSLFEISYKTSRLFARIYKSLKQMVMRRPKSKRS